MTPEPAPSSPPGSSDPAEAQVGYQERLPPPWWMWGLGIGLSALLTTEVTLVGGRVAGAVVAVVVTACVVLGLRAWTLSILIHAGELRVGRAVIPLREVGPTAALEGSALRLRAGRDADPAAYLALRPWTTRALEIAVLDPTDPTPYWLVGSRDPARLDAAIAAERTTAG